MSYPRTGTRSSAARAAAAARCCAATCARRRFTSLVQAMVRAVRLPELYSITGCKAGKQTCTVLEHTPSVQQCSEAWMFNMIVSPSSSWRTSLCQFARCVPLKCRSILS